MKKALLACGVVASLVYVAANVVCAVEWRGYSSFSQTISELSAIGAPTRPTWIAFAFLYSALLFAFGIAVWQTTRGRLRVTAACLIAIAAIPYWPPMHMRGQIASLTDTMHAVTAAVVSVLILVAIGFGANAFGRRFRIYSITTVAALVVFGASSFLYAPLLAANLPTLGMGFVERLDLAAYLGWVSALAIGLMRRQDADLGDRPDSPSVVDAHSHRVAT
jgi:hypothetical protein